MTAQDTLRAADRVTFGRDWRWPVLAVYLALVIGFAWNSIAVGAGAGRDRNSRGLYPRRRVLRLEEMRWRYF